MKRVIVWGIVVVSALFALVATAKAPQPAEKYLSPCALAQSGKMLYVACATGRKVLCFDTATAKVAKSIAVSGEPTGLAVSGSRLYVTRDLPGGRVCVIDLGTGKTVKEFAAGSGACAPVLAPGGKKLFVCNRFADQVAAIDPTTGKLIAAIPVKHEPIAAAITPDGKWLVVANHLIDGTADAEVVSASVSIIDAGANKASATIKLPNGSTSLKGVCISPDGKYAYVTHILGRYSLPTTQLERGWMNTNALSIVDVPAGKLVNTVLLDDIDAGAANPWAVACSADGKYLCVTQSGTHELSVIDAPAMMDKLAKENPEDAPNDLAFMSGIRQRVQLDGKAPRAVAVIGDTAYTAEYFTDSMSLVNLKDAEVRSSVALGPKAPQTERRKGEMLFADAAMCFQGWQSCTSCHPDARTDGLNWDLLNDGIGNPKNSKNMLLAHRTPPSMSQGIRDKAETAVRAGIRYIQFAVRPESDAQAIDTYLKSLTPFPSPALVGGQLSAAAIRGKKIFLNPKVGCASCHPAGLYTNLKSYDVGTRGKYDGDVRRFDTPTLVEVWRTAPYMHDGSAATLRDALTTHNKGDKHGRTSQLSAKQMDDLVAYVRSL